MTNPRHAVVNGSLGIGNLGDETLLATLMRTEARRYVRWTVIGGPRQRSASDIQVLPSPQFAMGRVPWRGAFSQRYSRRSIERFSPMQQRDYVWVGGLFGNARHILGRVKEAQWCRRFCERIVYYFGDAEYGEESMPAARSLAEELNKGPSWIAVRSSEAAERLAEAGYQGRIWVGLDIVLHDRIRRWGLPFERRTELSDSIVINPVKHKMEFAHAWLGAARAAVKFGLRINWVSFFDPADLEACHILRDELKKEFPNHPQEICSIQEAESAFDKAVVCVATRYHAAISAFTNGVPVLAVPYSSKVSWLFHRLGLSQWIEVNEISADGWRHRLRDLSVKAGWTPDWSRLAADAAAHDAALGNFQAN